MRASGPGARAGTGLVAADRAQRVDGPLCSGFRPVVTGRWIHAG